MTGLFLKKTALQLSCDQEMVCDTPVPYYRTTVSCGRPNEFGDVPAEEILLPSMMISGLKVFVVDAGGDSMEGARIFDGDPLLIEKTRHYDIGNIVLAVVDGEQLVKTYYVDDMGRQWLVPANKRYKATKLTSSMKIVFKGRLIHHMRRAPQDSTQHIMECIQEAKELLKRQGAESEEFKSLVAKPEYADKVVARLHELSEGKQKPKDILMPLRAAIEAGAIRRPTWAEYGSEFGFKRTSKTSLSDYTDPTRNKFADEQQFWTMVDDFRKLIAR